MSKLVALWDKSYQFDDDELAAFAAIHNDLAKPFLPDPDYEEQPVENPGTFSDWYMKLARDPLDSSHQPDIIAPELLTEYKELTSSYQSAVHLKENLDALMELTRTLSESLDLVKAKSNGMKSLWEGLLTQHEHFDAFANRIEERLAVFTDFDSLQTAIQQFMETNKLTLLQALSVSTDTVGAMQKCFEYGQYLMVCPECNKEAPLQLWRYKQLIGSFINACQSSFESAIDTLQVKSRELTSPLPYDVIRTAWEGLVSESSVAMKLVKAAAVFDKEAFGPVLHACLSKYLANRHDLFLRRLRSSIPSIELKGAMEMLDGEEAMFGELFGMSEDMHRHFEYFCQQSMRPALELLGNDKESLKLSVEACQAIEYRLLTQKWFNSQTFD